MLAFCMNRYTWANELISVFNEVTNNRLSKINTQVSFMKPRNFRNYLMCYIAGMNETRFKSISEDLETDENECRKFQKLKDSMKSISLLFWGEDFSCKDKICKFCVVVNRKLKAGAF